MKIKHRYTFRNDCDNNEIVSYLDTNSIKYEISSGIPLVTLEIFEHEKYWPEIKDLMDRHGKTSLSEIIYSKSELNDAKWLQVRSKWRAEYPQPEKKFDYKRITYNDLHYCPDCGCGLTQKSNFQLKKTPKWGKKNFLMLNWIEDELFITENVAEGLNISDLKGFSIRNVDKYKTGGSLNNIYQLYVENYLAEGLLFEEGEIVKEIRCDTCNSTKRVLSGVALNRLKNEVIKDCSYDIVKTTEKFGDGRLCASSIFITNKMYKFIVVNKWDNQLCFEPVIII